MIKEIIANIQQVIQSLGFEVGIGNTNLSKPRKFPFVQIIPDSGQRQKYVGGMAVMKLNVNVLVIRRALSNQIEESEQNNLGDLEKILKELDNKTFVIENKNARVSVTNFQLDRLNEEEMNFYLVGSAVVLEVEFYL